jgi:hypothetical protein
MTIASSMSEAESLLETFGPVLLEDLVEAKTKWSK